MKLFKRIIGDIRKTYSFISQIPFCLEVVAIFQKYLTEPVATQL